MFFTFFSQRKGVECRGLGVKFLILCCVSFQVNSLRCWKSVCLRFSGVRVKGCVLCICRPVTAVTTRLTSSYLTCDDLLGHSPARQGLDPIVVQSLSVGPRRQIRLVDISNCKETRMNRGNIGRKRRKKERGGREEEDKVSRGSGNSKSAVGGLDDSSILTVHSV